MELRPYIKQRQKCSEFFCECVFLWMCVCVRMLEWVLGCDRNNKSVFSILRQTIMCRFAQKYCISHTQPTFGIVANQKRLYLPKKFTLTITGYLHVQADRPKNKRHNFLLNFYNTKFELPQQIYLNTLPIPLIALYLRLYLVCEVLFNPIFPLDFMYTSSFSMFKRVDFLKIAVQIVYSQLIPEVDINI